MSSLDKLSNLKANLFSQTSTSQLSHNLKFKKDTLPQIKYTAFTSFDSLENFMFVVFETLSKKFNQISIEIVT